jgi:8-oxo-dGTP pyrophosphatase MutT (NUDIX family)
MNRINTTVRNDPEQPSICENGYATPKVDVRAAVYDDDDRVLMVRKTSDDGHWTLPGGWADGEPDRGAKHRRGSARSDVDPLKLAAVWDS